jgi:hypothetical protein
MPVNTFCSLAIVLQLPQLTYYCARMVAIPDTTLFPVGWWPIRTELL